MVIFKPLEWTEERNPDDSCDYTHVSAETPFGQILITWKGWKSDPDPTVETPWGAFLVGINLEDAKAQAQKDWEDRISSCLRIIAPLG